MRVLLLYNRIPYPLHDGGALAVDSMARGLAQAGCEVHLFCLNASRSYVPPAQIPSALYEQFHLREFEVDTHLRPLAAAWNLLEGSSYHISRFYEPAVARALADLLQHTHFDIVQLEATFMGVYLPTVRKYSKAKVVLRAHNVDYRIWERLATGSKQPLKRWYLQLQAARLKKFEEALYAQTDGCMAISPTDAEHMAPIGKKPTTSIGMGIELPDDTNFPPMVAEDLYRCLFLGSLDWQPNQEAVTWLQNDIWPAIKKISPQSNCLVAGKNAPAQLLSKQNNDLSLAGFVANAHACMRQNPLFLVPMRSGSGIRIKILEALSLGLPVVSTRLGAEGIPIAHQAELWLAESPLEFAEAVQWLQQNPNEAFAMGQRGKAMVAANFNRQLLSEQAQLFYQNLIQAS